MKRLVSCIVVLMLGVVLPVVAHAQEDKGWKFSAGTMLWMPGLDVEATANDTTVDGSLSFSDLLGKLQGALAGEFSARKGNLSFQVDTVNYYLKDSISARSGGDREVKISMNWLQGLIGYRIFEKSVGKTGTLSFEPTVGYRQYWNRFTIDRLEGGELADNNPHWGDVIFGGRVIYDVNEKFSFFGSGTYGGFDWGNSSKYSWSAAGGMDWHFSKNKTLRVGYMAVSFKKEENKDGVLIDRVSFKETLSGPLVSLIWHF